MVWIHGGALLFGGVNEFDASALAIHGDVVVVAISYRLNALGFAFGNFGLWDQLEGMFKIILMKFQQRLYSCTKLLV